MFLKRIKSFSILFIHLSTIKRFLTGKFLGSILGKNLKQKISNWKIDYIIPVPLHHLKNAERGYNQSFYIAKGLSKELNVPVAQNFIKRKRFTESQTTMSLKERQENIEGAFQSQKKFRTLMAKIFY